MNISTQDILYMAATIWGEARGERYAGKIAVGRVIMNRLRKPGWWSAQKNDGIPDHTIAAVCIDPLQFSCWNKSDPQSPRVRALVENGRGRLGDFIYRECLRAALEVIDAVGFDETRGSTHYHTGAVHPSWSLKKTPVAVIGNHLFYNDIE